MCHCVSASSLPVPLASAAPPCSVGACPVPPSDLGTLSHVDGLQVVPAELCGWSGWSPCPRLLGPVCMVLDAGDMRWGLRLRLRCCIIGVAMGVVVASPLCWLPSFVVGELMC